MHSGLARVVRSFRRAGGGRYIAAMFLFGLRRFGRFGPLGLAYTAYRLWRRLTPAQKARLRGHAAGVAGRARGSQRAERFDPAVSEPGSASLDPSGQIGAATAPAEEIPGG
jgi:hypothetical protein